MGQKTGNATAFNGLAASDIAQQAGRFTAQCAVVTEKGLPWPNCKGIRVKRGSVVIILVEGSRLAAGPPLHQLPIMIDRPEPIHIQLEQVECEIGPVVQEIPLERLISGGLGVVCYRRSYSCVNSWPTRVLPEQGGE